MADPTRLDSVREVLQRHKETLMRDYRAAGVGIGKRNFDDAEYVIVVYLATAAERPEQPRSVEGIPLKFEVTGTFKPFA